MTDDASLHTIELGDPNYPARLLDLKKPPELLYVRGSLQGLSHMKTVAIVGSRKATVRGTRLAYRVARELGQAGVVVISGGALGIDNAAHRGCLDASTPTISVLAGGVDRPTPRRHAADFAEIAEQGALLSEYPAGTRPRNYHYHRRNDIIAALGDATLVVRATPHSGTMITARAARKLGRPLCALPGALDDPLAEGCHELIVTGAQCVRGAGDILEHVLGMTSAGGQLSLQPPAPAPAPCQKRPEQAEQPKRPLPANLSDDGLALAKAIRELAGTAGDAVSVDQLARRLDWSITRLNGAILEVELTGAIAKQPGANAFVWQ